MKANSKTKVQSCDDPAVLMQQDSVTSIPTCKYQSAIDLISAAIESLAEIARDDQVAKDSIANLGVVMLDLKGNC